MGWLAAPAAKAENLLANPGFEQDADGNGLPDGWTCHGGAGEAQPAIRLDDKVKRSGRHAVRISHRIKTSYSRLYGSVPRPKAHTAYAASCW